MDPQTIRQIIFFRPGAVGDFVFALPCLATLKSCLPEARLTYIGDSWHKDFLSQRASAVDEVLVLPACEGINAKASDDIALERFIAGIRERSADLALQAYGGGRFSNPLIRRLGARLSIGWRAADAPALDRSLPFHELQNRRLQLLELAALAGANAQCTSVLRPGITLTMADRQEAEQVLPNNGQAFALLQPGASDPRRRWPAENFARVGDWLSSQGMCVAVNGTSAERETVLAVISAMRCSAVNLSDLGTHASLTLGGLCGLLHRATFLVSNDTGPLHLATELGTPAVGIYWLTNLIESLPLQQSAHRAAWAKRTHCTVCGMDNVHQRCEHQQSFVSEISVEEVIGLVEALLNER